nr:hypothetical protein [Paenibacillus tengchongensis]
MNKIDLCQKKGGRPDLSGPHQGTGSGAEAPRLRIGGEGIPLYFYDYDNNLFELHTGTLEERLASYKEADRG